LRGESDHIFLSKPTEPDSLTHAGGNDLSRGGIASRDSGALATLPPLLRETTRQKLQ